MTNQISKKQTETNSRLSDKDLDIVAGGLNPQPLPPAPPSSEGRHTRFYVLE